MTDKDKNLKDIIASMPPGVTPKVKKLKSQCPKEGYRKSLY